MLTAKQLGKQLIVILVLGMTFIAAFYTVSSYFSTKETLEKGVLEKLHSIALTTSMKIDGDKHTILVNSFDTKIDSNTAFQDYNYSSINKILTEVKSINNLKTDLYTLFVSDSTKENKMHALSLGVISGSKQYYMHEYTTHPKLLINNFEKGGMLEEYKDEHGIWLSAFAPIFNSKNEVVAVVQVDQKVDDFLDNVWDEAIWHALVSLLIIIVVSSLMIVFITKMVRNDRKKADLIESTSKILQSQNKKITNSINYAQRLQGSVVPKEKELQNEFENSFIYSLPKDIVSGDFPWVHKCGNSVYFAAMDCTGHGVPGALVSIVGYFLLNKVASENVGVDSLDIFKKLHEMVNRTFKQKETKDHNNDGMDGGLCKVDLDTLSLSFAGAHRPLYHVRDNVLTEYKGARRGLGGLHYDRAKRTFDSHTIQLQKGDRLFVFSDGYVDQFGGPDVRKFGSKRLRKILCKDLSMSKIKEEVDMAWRDWKGDVDQTDDVLVVGVQV